MGCGCGRRKSEIAKQRDTFLKSEKRSLTRKPRVVVGPVKRKERT